MEESTTKEKILKSVRNALINKTDNPFKNVDFSSDLFPAQQEGPEVEFALRLNESGGTFIYCDNEVNFIENLQAFVVQEKWEKINTTDTQLISLLSGTEVNISLPDKKMGFKVSLTRCDYLISRFGSVLVSSALTGRNLLAGAETHLVVAKASQVVREIKDSLSALKIKYNHRFPSQVTMIKGPNNTTNLEKTSIMGAHGSNNLVVFMIDDA